MRSSLIEYEKRTGQADVDGDNECRTIIIIVVRRRFPGHCCECVNTFILQRRVSSSQASQVARCKKSISKTRGGRRWTGRIFILSLLSLILRFSFVSFFFFFFFLNFTFENDFACIRSPSINTENECISSTVTDIPRMRGCDKQHTNLVTIKRRTREQFSNV